MRYEVWTIEWYAELDKALCIGCAATISAAQHVIYHHRQAITRWHYDIRVAATGGVM